MRIDILTLFPEMFSPLEQSIIGRARTAGAIEINIYNIRDYTKDRHNKCDDVPFGGGAGMVMTPQPLYDAIKSIDPNHDAIRIYMSPKGETLNAKKVKALSETGRLLLLCGHYEGIDQRIIDLCIDEEISVGDYVLTGGELPAMVLTDSVSRQIEGVLSQGSLSDESFENSLLEYPQYTRPQTFMDLSVPEVLLSGHHENIRKWRYEKSLEITKRNRPDLLNKE